MGAITEAFKNEYHDVLMMLVQQKNSRLTDTVMTDMDFSGEAKYYDQLGQTAVISRTSRNQTTPIIDASWDKRKLVGVDYLHNFVVDKVDRLSMAIDPNTGLVTAQARAFARQKDKTIYDALLGTAYSGKAGTTSNAITTTVTASSGLTVDKMLEIKQAMDLANCDDPIEDPRYLVVTSYEITDLLNTTEVKSSDYNTVKALAAGQIDSFCGFKVIVLPPNSVTNGIVTRSSNVNYCVAYAKSGLMFGMKSDIETRIDQRADLNYSTQFWAEAIFGAVRLEEAKVVAVNVTNAS
jgi:hypothetical protein